MVSTAPFLFSAMIGAFILLATLKSKIQKSGSTKVDLLLTPILYPYFESHLYADCSLQK